MGSSNRFPGFGERSADEAATLYDRDFYEWTQEQARLLRGRRFDELDLDNLVDEVASVGRSDKREIRRRLEVLLAHLLKWKFQPGRRTPSWRRTIDEQRSEISRVVDDSPSLRRYPSEVLSDCYVAGHRLAAEETGFDFTLFPEGCPFTIDEVMDPTFLPKEPDLYDRS